MNELIHLINPLLIYAIYSNSNYLTGLLGRLEDILHVKGLTQCLAYNKYSVKAIYY